MKLTFPEFVQLFKNYIIVEKNGSQYTITNYLGDLNQFYLFLKELEFFAGEKEEEISKIDRIAIRSFMGYLSEKNYSAASMGRKLASLSTFFKFLCREGYLQNNPAKSIPIPRKISKLPSFLTTDEMFSIMELPGKNSFIGTRDKAILELFYSTGIRVGELVKLSLQHIDIVQRNLRILGKGKKERLVPFGSKAAEAINTYLPFRVQKMEKLKKEIKAY